MKRFYLPVLFALLVCVTSCEVVGGIFKAGVWVGMLVVVAIIGLVVFVVSKVTRK